MLAVVSSSSRPSCIAATARAAATTALRPSSGAMPACAAVPRNSASMRLQGGRGDDQRARRAVAVEHEHAARRERGEVERLGAQKADLLAGREHELDVARGRLGNEPAREHEQGGDCGLVVGAEHRLAVAAHEAVGDDDPRSAIDGHRVEVGAEGHGGRHSASWDPGDEVAAAAAGDRSGTVFADLQTEVAEIVLDDVGDLPLGAGRRRDAGEPHEEVEQLVV